MSFFYMAFRNLFLLTIVTIIISINRVPDRVLLCFLTDTFASKVSAIQDTTADNSVGNVTGSNAVNVFLGLGIAWSLAAIYHAVHGNYFYVDPGK